MDKTFGIFLRTLREERQLTLRQVEERVRISNGYLSQIERGERRVTSFKILAKLAEAYGVSMDDLLKAAKQDAAGSPRAPTGSARVQTRFCTRSKVYRMRTNTW